MGDTNLEILMQKLINGETIEGYEARSRLEEHLLACINGTGADDLGTPRSVAEALLQVLAEQIQNGEMPGSAANGLPLEVDELPSSGGTAVPNSGYVEKVYFNTSLSTEEVVNIVESANLTYQNGYIYVVCTNEDGSNAIMMGNYGNGVVFIADSTMSNIYFSSDPEDNGWDSTLKELGVIPLDITCVSETNGITVGLENDKLTNLFSTTPFGGNAGVEGAIYKVGSASGTAVPVSGEVGDIYLNTNLSVEKVCNICSELLPSDETYIVYAVAANQDDIGKNIVIIYYGESHNVTISCMDLATGNDYYFFNSFSEGEDLYDNAGFVGWNPEFNGVFNIGGTLIGENPYINAVSYDNDKLSELFSTTPFSSEYHLCENGSFTQLIPEDEVEPGITEISAAEDMNTLLVAENVGKIYKYSGETNETFTNGAFYEVEEDV